MAENDNQNRAVRVTIYGQEYPIKGRGDEEYIKKIARFVDDRMLQIEEQTTINSPTRLAILAALNIADELFSLQQDKDQLVSEFESKAREISEHLNQGMTEI
ncbi:cell division protein ZapA [bacterium]|nr:cell division protein ZapA [bacterium]